MTYYESNKQEAFYNEQHIALRERVYNFAIYGLVAKEQLYGDSAAEAAVCSFITRGGVCQLCI